MAKPSSRLSAAALVVGNGVLLVCGLAGLALSFVSLYPLDLPPVALLPQAALFALLSLCAWSLPRWPGRICRAGLAALWGLNLFLRWKKAAQGAMLVFSVCLDFSSQRLGCDPLFRFDPPPGVSRTEIALTFLTLALALIALLLGAAVVRLRRWWLAMLLTLPPLLPVMITSAMPHWAGFTALCVCWFALLLSSLCRRAEGRGWLILAASAASAALLLGVAVLFPSEGYTRPQWALDAGQAVTDFGDRFLTSLQGRPDPSHPEYHTPPASQPADSVDLSGAGARHYTGRPVLEMRVSAGGHYFLRGVSMDTYTGSSWEAFPDEVWEEYASALPEGGWTGSPLLFPGYASPNRVCSVLVSNVDRGSTSVFLPYLPVDQDWDEVGAWPVRDRGFQPAEGVWSFSAAIAPYDRDLSTLTSGVLSSPTLPGPVAQAEEIYRDYVHRHYLDVPEGVKETLTALLTEAPVDDMLIRTDESGQLWLLQPDAGFLILAARRPDLAADLIRDLLAGRCVYDLETPATPEGEDFVTWFLNGSRQGYCLHFATAGTLMFRTLGIPARFVTGYTANVTANTVQYVPDSAAHAWVEIYVDGWGWYPVEVTTGFSDGPTDQVPEDASPTERPATLPPEASRPPRPTPTPAPSRSPGPGSSAAPTSAPGAPSGGGTDRGLPAVLGAAARLLAALAAIAALLWLFQFGLKAYRRRRLSGTDANRAVLDCYRCLSRMGPWGGEIPAEAKALAEKAMYGGRPITEEERQTALALYDGQRRRLCRRLSGWRRLAFLYLWGGPGER